MPSYGAGVILGFADSGIDYNHPLFKNKDGSSKILEIWDQTSAYGNPPSGYSIGTVFTKEQLESNNSLPTKDLSGHGTHVAGIASAVAPESQIIMVKLGTQRANSFPRTSELMQAVDYLVKKGIELNRPIAINLSFGNTYGSHAGTSLLETFISSAADRSINTIVVGSGNEGAMGGHYHGKLGKRAVTSSGTGEKVELAIGMYETSINLQLWKRYNDIFSIDMIAPSGRETGPIGGGLGTYRYTLDNVELLIYYGEPAPYSQYQEIYIDFIAKEDFIESGIWTVSIIPINIVNGEYDMWLPSSGALNEYTRFLKPSPNTTLTIPSTSPKVVTVGAYNALTDSYADFSGRGYTNFTDQIKPDIVAPGVNVRSASPGGGYSVRSGTSMAAPFATGGAALMMEWGVVRENDKYLYGEKVKAYLIRGARQLPGLESPNPLTGDCVKLVLG